MEDSVFLKYLFSSNWCIDFNTAAAATNFNIIPVKIPAGIFVEIEEKKRQSFKDQTSTSASLTTLKPLFRSQQIMGNS